MARCSFSASTADQISMRSIKHNEEGQLYAFDMLAGEDDDMRQLPLSMGKANLAGCRPVERKASSTSPSLDGLAARAS